jgi:hypothetical protein
LSGGIDCYTWDSDGLVNSIEVDVQVLGVF